MLLRRCPPERFFMDRKIPLNIFLIIGQSNAYGTYDVPEGRDEWDFRREQMKDAVLPEPGTVFCLDVDNVGGMGDIYDLSSGRPGFSPALGKRWYELTGERTVMLQTAVGGAPIESWLKPEDGKRYTYGDPRSNFYETTLAGFRRIKEQLLVPGSQYCLNRVFAFWLQGETGMSNTYYPDKDGAGIGNWEFGDTSGLIADAEYYRDFMKIRQYLKEDFGCSFTGILLVRAVRETVSEESLKLGLYTDLVPVRAAQYAINRTTGPDTAIVSRVCDTARSTSYPDKTAPGYGLMGCNDLHYTQKGHNANGIAAAENTYAHLFGTTEAGDIEIIAPDGRKRFADGDTVSLRPGEAVRTAAAVLPLYTGTPELEYISSDSSVFTADVFGTLTAAPGTEGKTAVLTVKCPAAGLIKKLNVAVGK